MGNAKKAQETSLKSRDYAMAKDKENWLALFADDAIVQDPVGKSPFDPSGEGHKGKEAIAVFFDKIIAPSNLVMDIVFSLPGGDECANYIRITHQLPNGEEYLMNMVTIYTANDEGKLTSLRAFWDFEGLMAEFAKASS